jgi:hypothetical protein
MFGLFKKSPSKESLEKMYQKLTDEAFKLSSVDQNLSKQKMVEAESVMKEIVNLSSK